MLSTRVALLVVVVALVVPVSVAYGGIAPDDRSGARVGQIAANGSNATAYPDFVERYVSSHKQWAIAPDDRVRIGNSAHSSPGRSSSPTQLISDTFQWSDAGVGAGGAVALMLICGGLVAYSSRRSRTGLPGF